MKESVIEKFVLKRHYTVVFKIEAATLAVSVGQHEGACRLGVPAEMLGNRCAGNAICRWHPRAARLPQCWGSSKRARWRPRSPSCVRSWPAPIAAPFKQSPRCGTLRSISTPTRMASAGSARSLASAYSDYFQWRSRRPSPKPVAGGCDAARSKDCA